MKNKKIVLNIKGKYGTFKAIFEWDKSAGESWFANVPNLPGAYTQGETLREAKKMARDVVDLICEELIDGNNIIIDDNNMAIGHIPHSRVISLK